MLGQRSRLWARLAPALGQRLVFVGSVDRPHCVSYIAWCEDNKTVAQLIEDKDDLVTGDIKTGSTTSKYIVPTVHRKHLITLVAKAIDTTSISYQPLWLCSWRETLLVVFCLSKYKSAHPSHIRLIYLTRTKYPILGKWIYDSWARTQTADLLGTHRTHTGQRGTWRNG